MESIQLNVWIVTINNNSVYIITSGSGTTVGYQSYKSSLHNKNRVEKIKIDTAYI